MTVEPLKPKRGGFMRPFRCGLFIRDFLLGKGPFGSPSIDPATGSPQADICYHYKQALRRATAEDRAVKQEEKKARKEHRPISPDNIAVLILKSLERLPYKSRGTRYHSFVVSFSNLQRLGWVEFTGREEPSAFQGNYPPGPPRKYFRLTKAGREASDDDWSNPRRTLYG
jgi:hypothetical protein